MKASLYNPTYSDSLIQMEIQHEASVFHITQRIVHPLQGPFTNGLFNLPIAEKISWLISEIIKNILKAI